MISNPKNNCNPLPEKVPIPGSEAPAHFSLDDLPPGAPSPDSPTVRVIPASYMLPTGSSKSVERIDHYLPPTGFFRSGTEKRPLRVAAYCRVSTELDSQKSSYELQLQYYTEFIGKHSHWRLVKIYADEGISGTSIRKRAAFQEMIADAKAGKIDYIITKSLSRFARNTVDSLNTVRTLQFLKPPVGIYFEKENIDTLDSKSELLITLLSALAQDESRSISENQKWAFQRRFQRGEGFFTRILGYEKGRDGQWQIQEEEARTVRFIFAKYLAGWGTKTIADALTQAGVKTSRNHSTWYANSILRILRNEKYVGDMLLQKTVKADLFSHYSIKNDGREPSYYVREHHPAIIGRATWEAVQDEINRRAGGLNLHGGSRNAKKSVGAADSKNCFKGKLRCGRCGELMVLRRKQMTVEKSVKRFWIYQCPSGCFEQREELDCENESDRAVELKNDSDRIYGLKSESDGATELKNDSDSTTKPNNESSRTTELNSENDEMLEREDPLEVPASVEHAASSVQTNLPSRRNLLIQPKPSTQTNLPVQFSFPRAPGQSPLPKLTQAALEQAFMEILYEIRLDYLSNGIAAAGIRKLFDSDVGLETAVHEQAKKGVRLLKLLQELPDCFPFPSATTLPFRYDLFSELVENVSVLAVASPDSGPRWRICFHVIYGGVVWGVVE